MTTEQLDAWANEVRELRAKILVDSDAEVANLDTQQFAMLAMAALDQAVSFFNLAHNNQVRANIRSAEERRW